MMGAPSMPGFAPSARAKKGGATDVAPFRSAETARLLAGPAAGLALAVVRAALAVGGAALAGALAPPASAGNEGAVVQSVAAGDVVARELLVVAVGDRRSHQGRALVRMPEPDHVPDLVGRDRLEVDLARAARLGHGRVVVIEVEGRVRVGDLDGV